MRSAGGQPEAPYLIIISCLALSMSMHCSIYDLVSAFGLFLNMRNLALYLNFQFDYMIESNKDIMYMS